MSEAAEERLRGRLRAGGLAHRAEAILAIAAPCIWLDSRREEDAAIPAGASKLGGLPDLPSDVEWPTWRDQPMTFIAQIRLDEAALYDDEGILPATGLLSIFFATDGEPKGNEDDDDPTSWRVAHLEGDPATFARRSAPTNLPEGYYFQSSSLVCSRWITLPEVDSPEYETLGLNHEERLAYIEVESNFHENERNTLFGTYLLGHPFVLNNPPLLWSYRVTHDIPYPSPDPSAVGWHWPGSKERERMIERLSEMSHAAAREWRLLFQTNGGASGIDFAGGGILHVTIPRDALLRRDFSKAWMSLDFV